MEDESKFYALPTESIPLLNSTDSIADLIEMREFFNSRGIQTKNTRIERYIQYLTERISGKPLNEKSVFKSSVDERFKSSTDWLLYVLREVHELAWILKGLKEHPPAGLESKLEMLVGGSDFAALDSNTHSRNVQFELRIASYFCQAGCEVDLTHITDIIALNKEYAFFVECKRVGSLPQLKKRLKEAKRQLNRSMPSRYNGRIAFGCIAADVTKAVYPHNGLTWAITYEHSKDILQNKLKGIANNLPNTELFSGAGKIIKYWLQIHMPCLIQHPPTTATRFSSYFIENYKSGLNGILALKILREVFDVSSRPDTRQIAPQALIPRKGVGLPKGTKGRLVEDRIMRELVKNGRIADLSPESIVAELILYDEKYEFDLSELEALIFHMTNIEGYTLKYDTLESRLEIVVGMLMLRYPYENSKLTPSANI